MRERGFFSSISAILAKGRSMRHEALTRNNDFARAYKRGRSLVHPHIVVYINKNRTGRTRVGITASKKIGGAVMRNRARRVIRHALAEVLPQNAGSLDLVLVARGQTPRLKSNVLAGTLRKLLAQANLPLLPPVQKTQKNHEKNTAENTERV